MLLTYALYLSCYLCHLLSFVDCEWAEVGISEREQT